MRVAVGQDVTQKVDHFSGVCVSPAKNLVFVLVGLVPVGLGLYLTLGGATPSCQPPPLPWTSPQLIAEMGAPDIPASPEWVGFSTSGAYPGTLATYERAVARGFSAVEMDVQVGRDGTLVVLSSNNLTQIGESSGRVSELDQVQLEALLVARDTPVALVSHIFAALGDQVSYVIQVPAGELGLRAIQELAQLAGERKVVVMGQDSEVLKKARQQEGWPTLWRGSPESDLEKTLQTAEEQCASGVVVPAAWVQQGTMEATNKVVVVSGVDNPESWSQLQSLGVGAAFTRFTRLIPGGDLDEGSNTP